MKKTAAPKNTPTSSYAINPLKTLYLVHQEVPQDEKVKDVDVHQPTHHIAVIDCSGSMAGDLPRLRTQLKNRLTSLLSPNDKLSLIWFSGRSQAGILLRYEEIIGVHDLTRIHKAIDQWLQPQGLTGFVDPLQITEKLVKETAAEALPVSLFFMSDGCDNQWDRRAILAAVEAAAGGLAAATFVEYGFYADRALLVAMAAKAGGTHVFAKDFPAYEPVFDAAMRRRGSTVKRRELAISGDPIEGIVYAIVRGADGSPASNELQTFEVKGNKVLVPDGVPEIYYLSPTSVGTEQKALFAMEGLYAAVSLFSARMKPDIIYPILALLGDVRFIEEFSVCFGKQRYSDFMQAASTAVFDPLTRLTRGYNPALVPADDAFTLLELLQMLIEDESRLLLDHPAFEYNRIGRARVEDTDAPGGALKFTPAPNPDGYPIETLTWNQERANVSVLVTKQGVVDLAERKGLKGSSVIGVPDLFPTFIFRNYALAKDGLINVGKLPVKISPKLAVELTNRGGAAWMTFDKAAAPGTCIIDLAKLPILNRKMIREATTSAKVAAQIEWELIEAQARQKVFGALLKEKKPTDAAAASPRLAGRYTDEIAAWLAEQGLTDRGFSPAHTKTEAAKDVYMAKRLEVKAKGFSSLPSLNEVRTKPSLKGAKGLMTKMLTEAEAWMKTNNAKFHIEYLESQQKAARVMTRAFIWRKAQIVFSTIVGQTWFPEFKTLDENTVTIPTSLGDLPVAFVMSEVEEEV